MSQLVVEAAMLDQLQKAAGTVELCDAVGNVVGTFVPRGTLVYPIKLSITEEELKRRASSDERRYSTAEVLKHLESL